MRRKLNFESLEPRWVLSAYTFPITGLGGEVIHNNIGAGNQHYYQFASPIDLEITVSLANTGTAHFQPQAKFQQLVNTNQWSIGSSISLGSKRQFHVEAGDTHRINLDNIGTLSGNYFMSLEGVNPISNNARPITFGEVQADYVTIGDVVEYTFEADSQDVITLSLANDASGDYSPRAELYDPSGTVVRGEYDGANRDLVRGSDFDMNKVVYELEDSGSYTIQVFDNNYTDDGPFALALERISTTGEKLDETSTPIDLGEEAGDAIEIKGDVDQFTYAAGRIGDLVTISLSDETKGATNELRAELYAPSGQLIEQIDRRGAIDHQVENGEEKGVYELPENASAARPYVIQVFSDDYRHTEAYGIAFEGIQPLSLDATAISPGFQVTQQLTMGEVHEYYFNGTLGQEVLFELEDTTPDSTYHPRAWLLYAQTNNWREMDIGYVESRGSGRATIILPQTGPYVVQVHDRDYTEAGDYTFAWLTRPRPTSITTNNVLIGDDDIGNAAFAVTVVFDRSMNTGKKPVITFSPLVGTTLLPNLSGTWSSTDHANDTYTATYTVRDVNTVAAGVDITVSQAEDLDGILQTPTTEADVFGIDTRNPSVTTITVSDTMITGEDVGDAFDIIAYFNEAMAPSPSPVVSFSHPVDGTLGQNAAGTGWLSGNTRYRWRYTVLGASEAISNIGVTVSGARDLAENQQYARAQANAFSIVPSQFDAVGFYRASDSSFHLRESNEVVGGTEFYFRYGPGGSQWIPLTGDWDGDGADTVGFYRTTDSSFHLRESNERVGGTEFYFRYGPGGSEWIPLAGDWDGDGIDTVGFYRTMDSSFHLRDSNERVGATEFYFRYGPGGSEWIPLAGDWDGDGIDTVGFYRTTDSSFHLRESNQRAGGTEFYYRYGPGGSEWVPLAGDWDGDGVDKAGFYRTTDSTFHLRESNDRVGTTEFYFRYGPGGSEWSPLAGNWDGSGSALQLDGVIGTVASHEVLTLDGLKPIVEQAIADWTIAGLDDESLSRIENTGFAVADLPGRLLGLNTSSTVYIDTNAAGRGWFVDSTPNDDVEFQTAGSAWNLKAIAPEALDAIDLLTVVRHELGHVLGLSDLESSLEDIMSESLQPGVRRTLNRAK